MLIYDFEVFSNDWLVVILDLDAKKKHIIVNDPDKLEKIYTEHENDIWVGFNNVRYDQYILKGILCGFNPKEVNDYIIVEQKPGWMFSNILRKIPTIQYDVMNTLNKGLKVYEGFQGSNIKESEVDFNINRKLTDDEIKETIKYCEYDVEQTFNLFIKTINDFNAHMELVKMIEPFTLSNLSKTKAQLSAMILQASRVNRDDEFDIILPDNLIIEKYTKVVDWYLNPENRKYHRIRNKKTGQGVVKEVNNLKINIAGVPHVYGWGGVHGAIPKYSGEGWFLNMDVASLYPSLMIEYDLLSRNCSKDGKKKYEEIYHERLKLKAEGRKKEQAPLKLVLNSTYGILKDKNNQMYDPLMANMVCIYGQLFILDLIEKLEPHCDIIQSNTDGILVKLREYNDYNLIDDICYGWEKRTKLKLEFDEYKKVFQKDVNNYIIVDYDGKYKSKGAYVKSLDELDNDLPIVNKSLVNYMIKGIPIESTINNCDDLMMFQKIDKISSKYDLWKQGNIIINERVIRSFASLRESDKGIFKYKGNSKEKLTNSSEKVFIDNGDVKSKKCPEYLDRQFYIDLAKKRLADFGGE